MENYSSGSSVTSDPSESSFSHDSSDRSSSSDSDNIRASSQSDDVLVQEKQVYGKCLHVCNLCNEGLDHYEDVRKHIVKYHQNVVLKLRMDLSEDEEREIDNLMKDGRWKENKL